MAQIEEHLCRAYAPLRLLPAKPDEFAPDLITRTVGRVTLGRMGFGTEVRINTAELTDFYLDVTLAGGSRVSMSYGREVETVPGYAAAFSPSGPARLWWAPNTQQWCVKFGADLVRDELTNLLGRTPTRPVVFTQRVGATGEHSHEFSETLRLLETVADDGVLAANPLLARRLEQTAVAALLLTLEHTYSEELHQRSGRMPERLARQAVDLLQGDAGRAWTVGELARDCGVSMRALYDGFREVTGTSPMNYLQQLRLDNARDMLLSADAETTVATVAYRWGFAHLGRFAGAYRKRFGETPSATLRSSR